MKNKESNIILKYEAPGVKLGVIISLIGLVGLIILSFVDKKFLVVEEGILKSNNKQLS